jgi:hypothetical protein
MQRPDDSSLTPGQLARVRKEAERALRESARLASFLPPSIGSWLSHESRR